MKRNLSLSLKEPQPHNNGTLEELVDRATEIVRLSEGEQDERTMVKERNRMIQMVLRSACEAIIRSGKMPLPLCMNLFGVGQPKADRAVWMPVPPEYLALCAKHGVKPEFAAANELRAAAQRNPAHMRFVSAKPLNDSDVLEDAQ